MQGGGPTYSALRLLSQAFAEDGESWIRSLICRSTCMEQKGEGDTSTWEGCHEKGTLLFLLGVEIGLVLEQEKH